MQGASCHGAYEASQAHAPERRQGDRHLSSRALQSLPTLTTMLVALASTLVLALAGCASSAGIAPVATTIAPAQAGLDTQAVQAATPDLAADWWHGFGLRRSSGPCAT